MIPLDVVSDILAFEIFLLYDSSGPLFVSAFVAATWQPKKHVSTVLQKSKLKPKLPLGY